MTTARYPAAGDARNRNRGGSICWHAESRTDGLRGALSVLLQACETLQSITGLTGYTLARQQRRTELT
jgi:hypothetical protein